MSGKFQPMYFHMHDESELKFGKSCGKGHIGPDKQGVLSKYGGGWKCLACRYKLEPGPFTYQFNKDKVAPPTHRSDEEGRKAHIQRVIQWRKDNPDKVKQWTDTYYAKPEVQERLREQNRLKYQDNKEKIAETNKKYYDEHKEEVLAYNRALYAKRVQKRKENEQQYNESISGSECINESKLSAGSNE